MQIFLKIITVIILVIVLLIVAATQLISTEDIFKQISVKVEEVTGRTLSVDGDKQLSFFPSLSLVLHDVRFANIQGGSRPDMATVAKLNVHIPWLSILSGELTIKKFVIVDPDILLETTAQGQANWQFSTAKNSDVISTTPQGENEESNSQISLPEAFDLSLGQVEIKGGKLTLIDDNIKTTKMIDQLSLAVLLPSLRQALNVSGSVRYMGQVFELKTIISTPAKVINNQAFTVNVALSSALAEVSYKGEIRQQGQDIKGELSISGDSVKELLAWQNIDLAANKEAFNQFSLKSEMHFVNNKLTLDNLLVTLDKLAFNGSSAITLTEPVNVVANIDLGILDLNPYLPQSKVIPQIKPDTETKSEPLVWDDSELDLSALGLINAELAIESSKLLVRDIQLGKNKITVALNNGIATVKLLDFQGYEGQGFGTIKVAANKKPYQITSEFELTNINAEPLFTDAAGFDKLLGKGQLAWDISTQGTSQRDFIHHLNGELGFSFIDGAVKGLNLAAIAKSADNILAGNLAAVSLDHDFSHAEKTDFAALTGTFTLVNGLANTNNISLNNPFIRVSGSGDIDLPKTKVNMLVTTEMVASAQGQAAQEASSGIKIPIKISGPFHQIKIRPDVSSEAKDKLKDKLKNKLKKLFG